jgi:hypothetical protein
MATKDQETGQSSRPDGNEARREDVKEAVERTGDNTSGTGREGREYGGVRGTMRSAVSTTEDVGRGVVGGAGNIATGVVGVVRDTANTLIDGVGSVGENAIHTVADLLTEVVGGVRQVAGAAVSGMRWNGGEGHAYGSHGAHELSRRDQQQATRRDTQAERAMH